MAASPNMGVGFDAMSPFALALVLLVLLVLLIVEEPLARARAARATAWR